MALVALGKAGEKYHEMRLSHHESYHDLSHRPDVFGTTMDWVNGSWLQWSVDIHETTFYGEGRSREPVGEEIVPLLEAIHRAFDNWEPDESRDYK